MRGQTTLDFATGVSVFLLTIVFVFVFVPGILTPFTQTAQEETVTTNRVADLVTKDLAASPSEPYILDGECAAALLSNAADPGCGFSGSTLEARLDLGEFQSVNITLRGAPNWNNEAVACWDSGENTVVNVSNATCDTELRAGDVPPEGSDSVVTARRIVSIEGTVLAMEVQVW